MVRMVLQQRSMGGLRNVYFIYLCPDRNRLSKAGKSQSVVSYQDLCYSHPGRVSCAGMFTIRCTCYTGIIEGEWRQIFWL